MVGLQGQAATSAQLRECTQDPAQAVRLVKSGVRVKKKQPVAIGSLGAMPAGP